jgi:SAM-dependent methyltransferase
MQELDFFGASGPRSADERKKRIERFVPDPKKRKDFLEYGRHYFDDAEYGVGYGGYRYDGRYAGSVDKMIAHYKLKPGSSILEIGCAKGFVLVEFLKRGMEVAGIDLSAYAVENAVPEVKPFIVNGSCDRLPWPSQSFDLVYSKETLPHLSEEQLVLAVAEAKRVCRSGNIFFEIQVGNEEAARQLISAWDETHQTVRSADWWRNFLRELDFGGQVNFKVLF